MTNNQLHVNLDKNSENPSMKVNKLDSKEYLDKEESIVVTRQYQVSIDEDTFNEFDIQLEINCREGEVVFAIENDFFNNNVPRYKNLMGENLHIPNELYTLRNYLPFFLFKKNNTKREDKNSGDILYFLNPSNYKKRLLEWRDNVKRQIERTSSKTIDLVVCVATILRLKEEIEHPTLSAVKLIDEEIVLKPLGNFVNNTNWTLLFHEENVTKTAVFIHGLASEVSENFMGLYKELKNEYNILAFSYPTVNRSIADNGKELAQQLNILSAYYKEHSPDQTIHIFAHSMGGLVSRWAMNRYDAPVSSLLMAGTPNNGAIPANMITSGFEDYYFFIALLDKFKNPYWKLIDLLDLFNSSTPGISDLRVGSTLIKDTNELEIEKQNFNRYYTLSGSIFGFRTDLVVSTDRVCRIKAKRRTYQFPGKIDQWNHFQYYQENDLIAEAVKSARTFLRI